MSEASIDDVGSDRARWSLVRGEALAVLRAMPDACVDAVITVPPYSSGGFTLGDRLVATSNKYVADGAQACAPRVCL